MTVQHDELTATFLGVLRRHLRFMDEDQQFPMDAALDELGLDSLSAINLLLDLEETFNIVFPDTLLTADTFKTAARLEDVVRSLAND